MKLSLRNLLVLSAIALVFTSCTVDNDSSTQQTAVAPDESLVETKDGSTRTVVTTNPNRNVYQVVIVDGDGWELCMNRINTRYGVAIYDGILWFSFGSVESTHHLSAAYYPSTNTLMVTSHEDYFNGGSILSYAYKIDSDVHNWTGFYHYMEHRYKSAPISGNLVQGAIGGYSASKTGDSFTPSTESREDAKGRSAMSDE